MPEILLLFHGAYSSQSVSLKYFMNSDKNKKINNCLLGYLPQAQLHGKILELVNNRINPYRDELEYDKGLCKSCVSRCEPQAHKRESKKKAEKNEVSRRVPAVKKIPANKKQPEKEEGKGEKNNHNEAHNVAQRPHTTLNLIKIRGQKLNIFSEVINLFIAGTSPEKQSKYIQTDSEPTKAIEESQLHQLKLEILDKQMRINKLQEELLLNKDYITELNKDIEGIRALATHKTKAYSDNHLCNNQALSQMSIEPPSLKEVIMNGDQLHSRFEHQNLPPSFEDVGQVQEIVIRDEHLMRIICTQAKQIQRLRDEIDFVKAGYS